MMKKLLSLIILSLSPIHALQLQEITPLASSVLESSGGRYITALQFHVELPDAVGEEINNLADEQGNFTLYDDDGWISMVTLARFFQDQAEQTYLIQNPENPWTADKMNPFYKEFRDRPIAHWLESFRPLIWRCTTKLYADFMDSYSPSFGPAAHNLENLARYIGPRFFKNIISNEDITKLEQDPLKYNNFLKSTTSIMNGQSPTPDLLDDNTPSITQPVNPISGEDLEHQIMELGRIALLENLVWAHHSLIWLNEGTPTYGDYFNYLGSFFEITAGSRAYSISTSEGVKNPDILGFSDYYLPRLNKHPKQENLRPLSFNFDKISQTLDEKKTIWKEETGAMKATSMKMLEDFPNILRTLIQ